MSIQHNRNNIRDFYLCIKPFRPLLVVYLNKGSVDSRALFAPFCYLYFSRKIKYIVSQSYQNTFYTYMYVYQFNNLELYFFNLEGTILGWFRGRPDKRFRNFKAESGSGQCLLTGSPKSSIIFMGLRYIWDISMDFKVCVLCIDLFHI